MQEPVDDENYDDILEESDIEFDTTDVVRPDNDPPQKVSLSYLCYC